MIFLSFALIGVVFGLCLSQSSKDRQQAAVLYGNACIFHFMAFELMDAMSINYPWYSYYIAAGFLAAVVVEKLQRMEVYTKFHERLQFIAILSIVINGVFGLIEFWGLDFNYYYAASVTLYLYLIKELLTNGMVQRVPRNDGVYMRLCRILK